MYWLDAGDPALASRIHGTRGRAESQGGNRWKRPVRGDPLVNRLCQGLDRFPGTAQTSTQTGRFLAATAERRRSGAGAVPEVDRWLLESVTRPGGVTLPRLRWARRANSRPTTPAHVSIAFDCLASRVECRNQAALPAGGVLEAHGLMLMPSREFQAAPTPHCLSFIPHNPDAEKHPGWPERWPRADQPVWLRNSANHLEKLLANHHGLVSIASKTPTADGTP